MLEVLVTVMLATFVGESFCERLVARLGLRELRQGTTQAVKPRSDASVSVLEMDSLGPRYSGSGDIGYGFVDFRGPKYRGS